MFSDFFRVFLFVFAFTSSSYASKEEGFNPYTCKTCRFQIVEIVVAKKGDGCISLTKKTKAPLQMIDCLLLAEISQEVIVVKLGKNGKKSKAIAPVIYPGDSMVLLFDKENNQFVWMMNPFNKLNQPKKNFKNMI